jgi:IS4 transposase
VREALTSLVPDAVLERLARETGVVRRQRKVKVSAFFWTLVLGFGAGRVRSLGGLRRSYERATGQSLVPSAFYDRFTPATTGFLRKVLGTVLGRLSETEHRLGGVLAAFREVLVADATLVKLHHLLAWRYPGTRTNSSPAVAKLHLVMSVTGAGAKSVKLSDGRACEHRVLRVGPWVRDRLLMFDLGYFRYQLFDCIDRNGGHFLSRLATNADPRIVATHRRWRGRAVPLEGMKLRATAERVRRQVLDAEVEVEFQRRVYRGVRHTARRRLRLVGVRLPQSREYRFYLTNIPPDTLTAEQVAQTYAARWTVELAFAELKSHYRLDELPSRKAHVVETLLLTAVLTLMVSRRLLEAVRARLTRAQRRAPEGRWAALFASAAPTILTLLLSSRRVAQLLARPLERMLLHEAADPNRSRGLLLDRVQNGTVWALT